MPHHQVPHSDVAVWNIIEIKVHIYRWWPVVNIKLEIDIIPSCCLIYMKKKIHEIKVSSNLIREYFNEISYKLYESLLIQLRF
jgi:hypothetical protein